MALRLQLETGLVKEYCTSYPVEEPICCDSTYKTICGMTWVGRSVLNGGCDHIECALKVCSSNIATYGVLGVINSTGIILFPLASRAHGDTWLGIFIGMLCLAFVLFFGWKYYVNSESRKELNEYQYYGTINGIKARQI